MSFTVFSYNATVLLIQPNPSHVLENATQPNPWMDPTHVHLWCEPRTFWFALQSSLIAIIDALDAEVGDLEHPATVDDAVGRLEVAVDAHWTQMQVPHSLHSAAAALN